MGVAGLRGTAESAEVRLLKAILTQMAIVIAARDFARN